MADHTDTARARARRAGATADEEAAAELSVAVGHLMRRLRAESPEGELTPTQRSVLSRLDRDGPATTAALARAEHVRPQSMRLTLAALEERGFLRRTPHPTDGRQIVVSLTPAGRRGLGSVRQAKRNWLAQAIGDLLDPDERRTLHEATALLERLAQS
ncbi:MULTISPECIES: MarR family winged helix-turn-helix transcriptional regulator [Streptomycetaceae]|uniref:Transcriptional regulator, MarR family n=1 Tax=Streptantibioticus cattleyicolor (strain ATCC 35852 / DSM 46488 / JCM 4925 / NBRC 14057 / NRRL 8057) TaxID=1003195 RepID=F8JYI8_STREN|nr:MULTISPECIES: MarR family transcriptional regulator [Streptomycetaceae]AEW97206.1 transcriptional regulator, MarR family [Streptantibioticus cattleyicolor NRRL 8057 = DSM 46488]MYS61661.1 MarR family transcriptional regulator [Streptomyces sp. SID5468]CCB77528.1 Transcriptional regulator, MarR family [Streptantibioticus cattleyicolor NRRL 8057 = DSM 46488]